MRTLLPLLLLIGCSGDDGATGNPTGTSSGVTTGGGTSTGVTTGGSTGTTTGNTTSTLSIEVGNGIKDHTALGDSDPVVLVHGPQGGWHIDVSGKASGFLDTVLLRVWAEDDAGNEVSDTVESFYLLANYDEATLTGEFVNQRAYLGEHCVDSPTLVCDMVGDTFRLCASVANAADPSITTSGCVTVTAVADGSDGPLCDAIADGSWYPGWPFCEVVPDCTVLVDPCCGDNPPTTASCPGTTATTP